MYRKNTSSTVYCPQCGKAGFYFRRVSPDGQLAVANLRDPNALRRHQPIADAMKDLKMVCANDQCGHVIG